MLKTGSTPRDRAVRSNASPNPDPSTGSAIEPIPKTSLMVALSNAGSKRRPEGASSSMQLTSKEAKLKNSKPTQGCWMLIPSLCSDMDGAYIGTTFPHLYLMTYPSAKSAMTVQHYVPKVFGFKLHKGSK
ncbi:hypothetical protein BHE74_00017391 [Ensete ventricosum]|nr:hypothetical protein BHE74_00017391 [Ensete ventricosum]